MLIENQDLGKDLQDLDLTSLLNNGNPNQG